MAIRERLIYAVDYVTDGAESGLKGLKKGINEAEGAVGKLKAGWQGAVAEFKNSRAAQAAVAAGAVALATKAVDAASDHAESVNAVTKVYGFASEAVLKLGDNSAEAYGMSKRALNEFAVRFSAFAKDIANQSGRSVVEVVGEMAQRVADFASVHNLSLEEAGRVAQSTLAGETEAFRRFGGDVSAATVKAHAYEQGIADVGSELTEQQKILARYSLFMEQTANTAGDFADTSDDLANAQRTLSANMEDLAAAGGQALLPVLGELTTAMNDLIAAGESTGISLNEALAFDKITGSAGAGGKGIGAVTSGVEALRDAVGLLRDESEPLESNYTEAMDTIANSIELATTNAERFNDELEDGAEDQVIPAVEQIQTEIDRAAERFRRFGSDGVENANEVADATEDVGDAAEDTADDVDDITTAFGYLEDQLSDRSAYLDVEDAFDRIKTAADEAGEEGVLSQQEAAAAARENERDLISLRRKVLDYANEVDNIPPQKLTEILALIDAGLYNEAQRLLADLERDRTAVITVDVRRRGAGDTIVPGQPFHDGGVVPGRHGEEVPAILKAGETVLPTHKPGVDAGDFVASAPRVNGAASVNLTVNAGMGADGAEIGRKVVDALERYYRSGGRPPRTA